LKTLLVNPLQPHLVSRKGRIYNRVWPPLSLANCAALLRAEHHDVAVLDANAYRMGASEAAAQARGYDAVFLSSAGLDRWQCPAIDLSPLLGIAGALRRASERMFLVGPHGTARPAEMLELVGADAVVRGEPEMTVLEICRGTPFRDTHGVTYRENGTPISTEDRKPFDLDTLPMPAFDLLPMDRYRYELLGNRFALFEGSRGCGARCMFCFKAMYGDTVRRKSPDKLIAEVDHVLATFGVRTAYFMDLEFTTSRRLVNELCDHLTKKNHRLKWTCQTRFDQVNAPLLKKMKKAGCSLIHFGVETGSDKVMKSLNKGISLDQIREGIKLVHAAGIQTACFFMFGFPGETLDDIRQSFEFAKELNPTYAAFHIAAPYPGTRFHDLVKDSLNKDELFTECYAGEIPRATLERLSRQAYFKFYTRPSYFLSRLLKGEFASLREQLRLFWNFIQS